MGDQGLCSVNADENKILKITCQVFSICNVSSTLLIINTVIVVTFIAHNTYTIVSLAMLNVFSHKVQVKPVFAYLIYVCIAKTM